jgi:ATP-dependent protease ClpP protease subunit
LYIYSDVEGDSYDWWGDRIPSETSAKSFRNTLARYPDVKNIDIYINSYGGSVMEGTAIYNQLKRHSAYKTAYIDGFAYSVASVIAMAADKVVMPRNTLMLIHNPWFVTSGDAAELRRAADELDTYAEASRQAYLAKVGEKLTEEKLTEMMNKETLMTAMQCVEYGFADELADYDADMSDAAKILEQAKKNGVKQLSNRLEKALALSRNPEPHEPNAPHESEPSPDDSGEKAVGLFEKFLNLKGEV